MTDRGRSSQNPRGFKDSSSQKGDQHRSHPNSPEKSPSSSNRERIHDHATFRFQQHERSLHLNEGQDFSQASPNNIINIKEKIKNELEDYNILQTFMRNIQVEHREPYTRLNKLVTMSECNQEYANESARFLADLTMRKENAPDNPLIQNLEEDTLKAREETNMFIEREARSIFNESPDALLHYCRGNTIVSEVAREISGADSSIPRATSPQPIERSSITDTQSSLSKEIRGVKRSSESDDNRISKRQSTGETLANELDKINLSKKDALLAESSDISSLSATESISRLDKSHRHEYMQNVLKKTYDRLVLKSTEFEKDTKKALETEHTLEGVDEDLFMARSKITDHLLKQNGYLDDYRNIKEEMLTNLMGKIGLLDRNGKINRKTVYDLIQRDEEKIRLSDLYELSENDRNDLDTLLSAMGAGGRGDDPLAHQSDLDVMTTALDRKMEDAISHLPNTEVPREMWDDYTRYSNERTKLTEDLSNYKKKYASHIKEINAYNKTHDLFTKNFSKSTHSFDRIRSFDDMSSEHGNERFEYIKGVIEGNPEVKEVVDEMRKDMFGSGRESDSEDE